MSDFYVVVPNWRTGNWGTGLIPVRPANSLIRCTKTGTRVDRHREKIKKGVSASSPYSVDTCRVISYDPLDAAHSVWYWSDIPYPLYTYTSKGFYANILSQDVGSFIPHLNALSSEADNVAIARLHKRIREGASEVNGLLVLGELRETIGMLRSPFKAAREATVQYCKALNLRASQVRTTVLPRRSDTATSLSYRRAQALKDGMAGSWLEFQFGIKPAISDAKDIVSALDRAVDTWTQRQLRFRATAKEPTVRSAELATHFGVNYTCDGFRTHKQWITDTSVQYIAIYRRSFDGSTGLLGRLTDSLGFSWENFVPTIWELVPWSFLIDYFINVGTILESATTSRSGLVTCTKTLRQKTRFSMEEEISSYSEAGGPYSGARFTQSLTGDLICRRTFLRTTLSRTVVEGLPIPSVSLSVPGWGSTKYANMAALLAQSRDISRFRHG